MQLMGLQKKKNLEIYPLHLLLCTLDTHQFAFLGTSKGTSGVSTEFYNCHPKLKITIIKSAYDENMSCFKLEELVGLTIDKIRVSTFSYQHIYQSTPNIKCELFPLPENLQQNKILAPFVKNIILVDSDIRVMHFFRTLNKYSYRHQQNDLDTDYKKEEFPKYFPLL